MKDAGQATGREAGSNLTRLVGEPDWQALAPVAGGIGRFVVDLRAGQCDIDATLRRITRLHGAVGGMPVDAFLDRIHDDDRPAVSEAMTQAAANGGPYEAEFRFRRDDGTEIWLAGQGRMMATAEGRDLLIGVNYDVTAQRRAQEKAELLAGEMAHRVKNLLALVQGMFNMAARSAPSKEALAEAFSGRLQAIAAVNTLAFAGEDRSVSVADLVDAVLGPMIAAGRVRVSLDRFDLNGPSAQTMVLVLNELLTNAIKHGALRGDDGSVLLSVEVRDDDFRIRWTESGGAPITAPEGRGGFGMRVLNTMTKATFDGDPSLQWPPEGLRFACRWPASSFGAVPMR